VEKAGDDEVGLGTVVRDGRFMGVVGLSFLVALIFQQGSVGLPVAMGEAGFTPADYGLAIAVNGVLIVALQAARDRDARSHGCIRAPFTTLSTPFRGP
jgi:hypothetical protein